MLTLDQLKINQKAIISAIPDEETALQAIRLGIYLGEEIKCIARVPAGPTVIQRGGMELAIGQAVCAAIQVKLS